MLITVAFEDENMACIVSTTCQNDNPPGTGVPVAGTRLPSSPSISIVKWTGPSMEVSVSIQPLQLESLPDF